MVGCFFQKGIIGLRQSVCAIGLSLIPKEAPRNLFVCCEDADRLQSTKRVRGILLTYITVAGLNVRDNFNFGSKIDRYYRLKLNKGELGKFARPIISNIGLEFFAQRFTDRGGKSFVPEH